MFRMAFKIKHFMGLVATVGITSLIFCMYSRDQAVDFHKLVTQTHKQFESFKEDLQDTEKKLDIEEKYLNLLGFTRTEEITGYSNSNDIKQQGSQQQQTGYGKVRLDATDLYKLNGTVPITIVSSVASGQIGQVVGFIKNVQSVLPTTTIVLWSLDTATATNDQDSDFVLAIKHFCNSSRCYVEKFNFDEYPDHVKDISIRAYRPLVIQMMLDRGGCVLWLDIDRRLLPLSKDTLNGFLNLAMDGVSGSQGIVGFEIEAGHPTSTLAHPKMFSYFQTDVENYYFHRMIDPAQLLVCNTQHVLTKIMLPWVKCILHAYCISPPGAQSSGCRFDKKPLFRYSGCHAYDSAALNVVLGLAYPLHQPYISRSPISRQAHLTSSNQTSTS